VVGPAELERHILLSRPFPLIVRHSQDGDG
jgi:hypothetical protein